MPTSQVDVTTKNIDESTSQQNTTVTGALAFFRGTTVHPVDTVPNPSSSIKKTNAYDFLIATVADAATGTVTSASPVANTFSTGTVDLTGGASGSVDGITVDSIEVMSGAESFDTTLTITAANVAANITANTSTPNYSATSSGTLITITADALGSGPNTFVVVSSVTTITTTDVNMAGGVDADIVTINGLIYTAVAGPRANDTQFSIDSTDSATATDLAAAITADTRTGTLGDVIAVSAVAVVTCTQTLGGTAGNATTLTSSDGTRLAVSGATFSGGTDGPITVNIATRSITVAKSIGTPVSVPSFFTSLTNDTTAAFFAIPKVDKNGNIDYDLIYTAVGAGAVTMDLNIVTLEVPVGATAPTFPVLENITDPVQVFSVLRDSTGLVKIYDYFMLSIP